MTTDNVSQILDEARYSPYVSSADVALLEDAKSNPDAFVDWSPANLALENAKDAVAISGSTNIPQPALAQTNLDPILRHFAPNAKVFWECRTNPSCKETPEPPVDVCDDCTFRTADILPSSFDFQKSSMGNVLQIAEQLYEGLLQVIPANGTYPQGIAGVARGYSASPDLKTWTFVLREDAKWSDGTPVTAEDFRYAWIRSLKPETGSALSSQLFQIVGAKAFQNGSSDDPQTVGVRVVDDHTLQVTLFEPDPIFYHKVNHPAFFPLPSHITGNPKDPKNLVSNGPYIVENYQHEQSLTLKKNPYYWDRNRVAVGHILLKNSGGDAHMSLQLFELNELDWLREIPSEFVREVASKYSADLFVDTPRPTVHYVAFRADKEPFNNVDLRRAVCQSIDRQTIAMLVGGGQKAATSFIHPAYATLTGYVPPAKQLYYDPNVRAQLKKMADALKAEYIYNVNSFYKPLAENLQEQLRNAGMQINVNNMEIGTYRSQIESGEFQMARFGWVPDYLDPLAFLEFFTSSHESNDSAYHNSEFDGLVSKALKEPDGKKRNELTMQAEKLLIRDVPMCPILFAAQISIRQPTVTNYAVGRGGFPIMRWMRMKK